MRTRSCLLFALLFAVLSAFSQTPAELRSMLPDIDGWEISGEVEVFDKDNLYNRINGAAPLFFENNFREMTSMEYTRGDHYVTIQAYRHASPQDAFGMYASERSSEMQFYDGIGSQAQGDEYGLYFSAGSIYVKMIASDEDAETLQTMRRIAEQLAANIDPQGSLPELFGVFPPEGKVPHSETYISSSYIGHKFLNSVYVVDYERDGKSFQVFLIEAENEEAATDLVKQYLQFARQSEPTSLSEPFTIDDRYNGRIPLLLRGRYVTGAFSNNTEDFPEAIFDFLNELRID